MTTAAGFAKHHIVPVACLLACGFWCSGAAAGQFDTAPHVTVTDPTRNYLPAKYYERLALDAMRRKDYAEAVSDYKQAAYWANKTAQYNLGEIYFHGIGAIPADLPRGVAWLGIAAEEHQPDYDKALVNAYASLSPDQRRRAGAIWKKLQTEYSDKLTLARATRRFERTYRAEHLGSATTDNDPTASIMSISGYNPDTNVMDNAQLVSALTETSTRTRVYTEAGFWSAQKQEFDQFITRQFGHVEVGPIESVPAPKK